MHGSKITSALVGAALLCCLGGCGSKSARELDGLELVQTEEVLSEFPLGKYAIPIPVAEESSKRVVSHRHRMQLDFNLYALVTPAETAQMADAWSRHEGKIRDQVMRVCRGATLEELQEPELTTLKARIIDALAGAMGQKEVRQLLVTEIVSQEL